MVHGKIHSERQTEVYTVRWVNTSTHVGLKAKEADRVWGLIMIGIVSCLIKRWNFEISVASHEHVRFCCAKPWCTYFLRSSVLIDIANMATPQWESSMQRGFSIGPSLLSSVSQQAPTLETLQRQQSSLCREGVPTFHQMLALVTSDLFRDCRRGL